MNEPENDMYGEENSPVGFQGGRQPRRLKKSALDKIVFGVCGGLGDYFSINSLFFRLLFLFGLFIGGWGIIIYLAASLLMPSSPAPQATEEDKIDAIRKTNNVTLIAGLILLGGVYIMLDDFGYFDFLSLIGVPSGLIPALVFITVLFFLLFFGSSKETGKLPSPEFRRSANKAFYGGVCGGFADYLGISVFSVRLAAVCLSLFTLGIPVLIYIFFLLKIPKEEVS